MQGLRSSKIAVPSDPAPADRTVVQHGFGLEEPGHDARQRPELARNSADASILRPRRIRSGMPSRICVTLTPYRHPEAAVIVGGRSIGDCAAQLEALAPPCHAGADGCSERLSCTFTGIPVFLARRAELLFERIGRRKPGSLVYGDVDIADVADALDRHRMDWILARKLCAAAARGTGLSPAMEAALGRADFHRTVREAGLCLNAAACEIALAHGAEPGDIVNRWEALLFRTPIAAAFVASAREELAAALERLGGDGPGKHMGNWGACGLFAEVLDGVLEGGGRYVVIAGRRFDPMTTPGCHHVAVRAGDWIADADGVSRIGAFLSRWRATFDDLHEVHMPDGGGFLDKMRPRGSGLLDAAAFRRDLLAAGVGPAMLEHGTHAEAASLRMP